MGEGRSGRTRCVALVGPYLSGKTSLALRASYARQSDWRNPQADYAADYLLAEANAAVEA